MYGRATWLLSRSMLGPAESAPADFTPPDQETLREDYRRSPKTSSTNRGNGSAGLPKYYTAGSGMEDLDEFLQELENREKPKGHWYYKSPESQPRTAADQQEVLRKKVEAAVQRAAHAQELPASRLGCALVEGALRASSTQGHGRHGFSGNHTAMPQLGINAGDMPSLLQQVLSTAKSRGTQVHPETSEAQGVLRKYRSVLRVQGRHDQKAAAIHSKRLAGARSMVWEHGLWLGSFSDGGEERRATFGDMEERASYWRQMADAYDVPQPPDTAFRRGKAVYSRPGVRASVDPARDAGRVVRKLGSLLAVCKRDFEAERRDPSQALLTRTMAWGARAEQLRFQLRPRLLLSLLRVLQSPANPPSIANVNVARLHAAWQASGAHNPQPWVLGRAQLVGILLSSFRQVSKDDAHRLVSCYDLGCRDRVRFAEISSNLMATLPPAQLLLQSLPEDVGAYRLGLTALRQMFRLYAQVTGGVLRYGTLLELLRSCTASVSGIATVDDGFRLFMTDMGRSLKDECTEEILMTQLKDQMALHTHPPTPRRRWRARSGEEEGSEGEEAQGLVSGCLLDVFQAQLQSFQAIVATHAQEQARQRLEDATSKPA